MIENFVQAILFLLENSYLFYREISILISENSYFLIGKFQSFYRKNPILILIGKFSFSSENNFVVGKFHISTIFQLNSIRPHSYNRKSIEHCHSSIKAPPHGCQSNQMICSCHCGLPLLSSCYVYVSRHYSPA